VTKISEIISQDIFITTKVSNCNEYNNIKGVRAYTKGGSIIQYGDAKTPFEYCFIIYIIIKSIPANKVPNPRE